MRYLETLLTASEPAREVKLFGFGQLMLARYEALYQKLYKEERSIELRRNLWGFVLGAVSTLSLYGCYAWIVERTVAGAISLGDMALYVTLFRSGQGTIRQMLRALSSTYEDNLYLGNLFSFLELPVPPRTAGSSGVAPSSRSGFVLEDVSFRYPGSNRLALDGVSLSIAPGEKLAIVGENGSGKSTLVRLLSGLHSPTSGRILLDGVRLDHIDPEILRKRFAVVLQDFGRYQFTAKDNIGLGEVEVVDDIARIERAAELAGATPVIAGLPKGLDTQLGRMFDGGVELSAGNWQKIAVARAFMRDADVLVLDEPTASLDAEAEHALFERFRTLADGRTALLISHRFSTVRMADRIVVLSSGKAEEIGTHSELVARGGRYARMFRLQAAGYTD
jgi:ATP-binding cassette subfamily B protein